MLFTSTRKHVHAPTKSTVFRQTDVPVTNLYVDSNHQPSNLSRDKIAFLTNAKYTYRDACTIVLSKVSGLGSVPITHLKDFVQVKVKSSRGSASNLRAFLPQQLADE